MDKFPLLWKGKSVGELTVEQAGLYTWFACSCRLPEEGLWCAWAVGDAGELRLGVLEPSGQRAVIRRRFSGRMASPVGKLLRGEVRPAAERAPSQWQSAPSPEALFRTPWLRRALSGIPDVLTRTEGERRYLAVPYDPAKPFALTPLFCFASVRTVEGRLRAVFCFDREELPKFL